MPANRHTASEPARRSRAGSHPPGRTVIMCNRLAVACLGGAILAVALPLSAAQAPANVLEIVVANGPLAGTYTPPATEVICLHAKKQHRYSAAWKDFSPKGAKAIAEVGINVSNPDDTGAKQGEVRVAFGDG